MSNKYILIFGDSIAWGIWDPESGGWADRLKSYLMGLTNTAAAGDPEHRVLNLSVPGDTTRDVLLRSEGEIKARLRPDYEFVIVFAVGINDSRYLADKEPTIPLSEFRESIHKLIKVGRRFAPTVICVGLTPVDESKSAPVYYDDESFYRNAYIRIYNDALRDICQKEIVHFIDIFSKLNKEDKSLFDEEDGVHLTPKSHEKIFEIVKDFLIEHKII